MITLKQFLETTNFRISEGSEYTWPCYGPNAYTLDAWNGISGTGGWSVSAVFDTINQTVYEVAVFDYTNDKAYRLFNPDYIEKYRKEAERHELYDDIAYDDVEYTDLTIDADWLEKTNAIVNRKPYDNRVQIEIELSNEDMLQYMKLAHDLDITFNELVNQSLQNFIDKTKRNGPNWNNIIPAQYNSKNI